MNRIEPNLPAQDYKTYQILQPLASHFRNASCREVGCEPYLNGWKTVLPADSDLIEVLKRSGRKYTVTSQEGGLIEFTFEAGQACFRANDHKVFLDRPQFFVVRDGDWRGNPRGTEPRKYANGDDWVDDFANHQDRLKTAIERG